MNTVQANRKITPELRLEDQSDELRAVNQLHSACLFEESEGRIVADRTPTLGHLLYLVLIEGGMGPALGREE